MRYGRAIPCCTFALAALAAVWPAAAQSSASFEIDQAVLNAGGDPAQGITLTSTSFSISLDSLGDALEGSPLSGLSYRLDGGLVATLRPPGETSNLRFTSKIDLSWDPEPAADGYRLYRGSVSGLPGSSGDCIAAPAPGDGGDDPALPAAGVAWIYLVTARNRLNEEGTPGYRSDGLARTVGTPCP